MRAGARGSPSSFARRRRTWTVTVEGRARELPATLEVSAYRVIQEALTNARKHASGATATVRVGYEPAELRIDVFDDGGVVGSRPGSNGVGGHGLIGMRERVGLHGGELRTGPRPGGGFHVHARFPLEPGAAP
jgi:signal transduction histidine kinase